MKTPRPPLTADLDALLTRAFAEDGEDITSLAVFGPASRVAAKMVCRERAVVSGAAFLPRLFAFLSPPARVTLLVADGDAVKAGTVLAEIEGPAITVLAVERTALNLVQRLTGIATLTRAYVDALKGTRTLLLDTRKTTPGLRAFERYAVRCGGGTNHRPGLSGGFLVKDNHADGAGSTWDATRRAADFRALNRRLRHLLLEAEARTLDEVHQALDAGAERVLLDNMAADLMAKAVVDVKLFNEATGADVTTEASGRMTPQTARAAAEAGVDFVSAGALTHSARAIDIALDIDTSGQKSGDKKKISLKVKKGGATGAAKGPLGAQPPHAPSQKSENPNSKSEANSESEKQEVKVFPARFHTPVLVLGTGIAGLTAALTLARRGVKVLVLTKAKEPEDCNTAWAQGGIIYFGKRDSPRSLVKDILSAGAGLCQPEAVAFLAERGPQVVKEILLKEVGVAFSRTTRGELDFTREGAHSVARIVHSADATGRAIETALLARLAGEKNVTLIAEATAIDLITARHHSRDVARRYALQDPCLGAYVLDGAGRVHTVLADFTVLATGGVGRLFLHTTNTRHAIGGGLAMAERAGAATLNLEYVQFHPTTLYVPDAAGFLISEALRGEGAVLVNRAGEAFMERYAPKQKDLAPRDVVTRAIVEEMTSRGEPCVYLDLAHHYRAHEGQGIRERFPTIAATCATFGIDIATEPIPVVPAAHYHCGGVLADLEGKTTIRRLYAVGEASCTGVHGANRLASTSLLEGLVWGDAAGRSIAGRLKKREPLGARAFHAIPDWQSPGEAQNEDPALLQQDWATIRNTLWNYVGIVRTTARLARAVADLRDLEKRILRFYQVTKVSKDIVDLTHGIRAAHLIATAAFRNPESRGCHYRKS